MTDTIRELAGRIGSFFRKKARDEEFDRELGVHLEMAMQEHLRQGCSPEEARRRALLGIGGRDRARELHRESRGLPFFETLLQDIRYGLRGLRRDAGLATFAIVIVGLGVGASSTVFSVVNALLLRPLPFSEPDRLVWVSSDGGVGLSDQTIQVGYLRELRAQTRAFTDVGAYFAFYGVGDVKLTGSGEPERLTNVPVTENFFQVLGVKPLIGRLFTPEECRFGAPRAVLLGYRIWQRRFHSDPGIAGRTITLNEQPATIVGVLPESFDFATLFAPGSQIDAFSPFPLADQTHRWGNTLALVGRLKPGATLESARAELEVFRDRMAREHSDWNGFKPVVTSLREHISGRFRPAMALLAVAVGLVMLIVCANLSNLLLARAATRQKEIGIRVALGAGKRRLVRQMLTESLVLSSGGALLGVALSAAGIRMLARLDAMGIPLLGEVRLDVGVLGFTLLTAVSAGLLFGLAPAIRVSRGELGAALQETSRGSSEGRSHGWIRSVLVACEVAMACVLLVGAGLLLRSFLQVLDVDMGFQPEKAIAMRMDPSRRYASQERRNAYFDEALGRVREMNGVTAAGLCDGLPLGTNRSWGVAAKGVVYTRENYPDAFVRVVSDGYLAAMGMRLVKGRDFTERDREGSQPVIIINETLAHRLWPGEEAVGRILRTDRPERVVVGVVRNVRHLALEEESGNEMYLPIRQTGDFASVEIVVRGNRPTAELGAAVRNTLRSLDPTLPGNDLRTLEGLVERSVSPRRFLVMLLTGFAGFAIILASLGIYGVISYSVNQRKQEIGIRMALGASAGDVQGRILLQTLRLAAAGMAVGLGAAWVLSRAVQGLLFRVEPADPVTFAVVVGALLGVTILAGYLPARRASRVNPAETLRQA